MAIWSKGDDSTNQLVHAFTVGDDYLHDRTLAPYDILGCLAHARNLAAGKIINEQQHQELASELKALHQSYQAGQWTVEQDDEDVHSKIEALLIEKIGDSGKVLHTGRSRNDQVLTAMRLWIKDQLCERALQTLHVIDACLQQATTHEFHPLPGYTHLQRGMPSSVGMFFAGHAQALLDNLILLRSAFEVADSCPLGSGASYGVGLPLQRELSAELLGFARAGYPAMADANSRGKVECIAIDAIGASMNDLSRFAADMIFFTTSECGFFSIAKGFTTGSSIMPQKKNLDLFELLRGRTARFLGLRTGLYASTIGLHSGYSRDLQDSKAQCMDAMRLASEGLALAAAAIEKLTVNSEAIITALSPDLYATDEAFRLVMEEDMSFRDAYIKVGQEIDDVQTPDHYATVKNRSHSGSTGKLGLERMTTEAKTATEHWSNTHTQLQKVWSDLLA